MRWRLATLLLRLADLAELALGWSFDTDTVWNDWSSHPHEDLTSKCFDATRSVSTWTESQRTYCCEVVGYGCHSPRPRSPEPPTPKRLPHDAVERIQLPPVTVRVGQRFEVPVGTFLGVDVTVTANGEAMGGWLHFDGRHGALHGEALATGTWRVVLRPALEPGRPRGSAQLELFVVDDRTPVTQQGILAPVSFQPLLVQHIPDMQAVVGQEFKSTIPAGSIVDPNLGVSRGTSLILSAALSSGDALPGWLHFEPLRAAFWGTPPYVEDLQLALRASIGLWGPAIRTTLTLHVLPAATASAPWKLLASPQLPVFRAPDLEVLVQRRFSEAAPRIEMNPAMILSASLDGEALPAWLTFQASNMTFSGEAPQVGDFQVSIHDSFSDRAVMTFLLRAQRAPNSGTPASTEHVELPAPESVSKKGPQTSEASPVARPLGPLTLGVVPDQAAEVAKPFGFQVPEGVTTDTGVSFTASLADGSPLPSWLKFDTKQMSFTGTPSQETELGISLKGTHSSSGRSAKTGFLLKVGSGGFKPFIAGHLPGITATAGQLFTESIPRSVISDPDGDILAFSLSSEEGKLPDWLHFDPNLIIVSGVPDKEQKLELSVTGRDTDGHSASTPLQLRVQEGVAAASNKTALPAPLLQGQIPDVIAVVNRPMTKTIRDSVVQSQEGGLISYSASCEVGVWPAWLHFDAENRTFYGTPTDLQQQKLLLRGTDALGRWATVPFHLYVISPRVVRLPDVVAPVLQPFSSPLPDFVQHPSKATLAGGATLPWWLKLKSSNVSGVPPQQTLLHIMVEASNGFFDFFLRSVGSWVDSKALELLRSVHVQMPHFDNERYCATAYAMYEPLDMNFSNSSQVAQVVPDLTACQVKCRQTPHCGHWTYFYPLKMCHMASYGVINQKRRMGFQGGPATCGKFHGLGSVSFEEGFLHQKCLVGNLSFMDPLDLNASNDRPKLSVASALECQQHCAKHSWCTTFVFNVLTKSCSFYEWDAKPLNFTAFYTLAGPRLCWATTSMNLTVLAQDSNLPLKFLTIREWESVLKAALVRLAGNYSQIGLAPEQLLTPPDISIWPMKAQLFGESPALHFGVRIGASSRNSLYFYHMLSGKYRQEMQGSFTEFVRRAAAKLDLMDRVDVTLDDLSYEVNGDFKRLQALKAASSSAEFQQAFTPYASSSSGLSGLAQTALVLLTTALAFALLLGVFVFRKVMVSLKWRRQDYLPLLWSEPPTSPYHGRRQTPRTWSEVAGVAVASRSNSRSVSMIFSV